jgi:hypothetical protein
MAPSTLSPKPAIVLILMAVGATGRQAKPCAIKILVAEDGTSLRGYMLRGVTGAAGDTDMFSVKSVAGFGMVKVSGSCIPVDHLKICTVVIGVTFHTSGACNR